MKGVLLAGGMGTRLRPNTLIQNKHTILVYDRPMAYYPIQTLRDLGCSEIIVVSGGEHIGGFAELLKDGSSFGVKFTYRVQPEAGGIAQALKCAEGLVDGLFPVILGDNYFSDSPDMPDQPTIFVTPVKDPQRFGVYDGKVIIEKPSRPKSDLAVIGLYVYDQRVFDLIDTLKPSARGELEVTDINNWYLKNGAKVLEYEGFWSDMGTIPSLNETTRWLHGS